MDLSSVMHPGLLSPLRETRNGGLVFRALHGRLLELYQRHFQRGHAAQARPDPNTLAASSGISVWDHRPSATVQKTL